MYIQSHVCRFPYNTAISFEHFVSCLVSSHHIFFLEQFTVCIIYIMVVDLKTFEGPHVIVIDILLCDLLPWAAAPVTAGLLSDVMAVIHGSGDYGWISFNFFFPPSVGKAIDKRKIFLEWLCSFDWTIKLAFLSICAAFSSTLKARKCSYLLVIKSRLAFKKVYWQKELDIFWILGSLWVRLFPLWWGVEPDKHFEKLSLGLLNWAQVWFMMPVWPHSF